MTFKAQLRDILRAASEINVLDGDNVVNEASISFIDESDGEELILSEAYDGWIWRFEDREVEVDDRGRLIAVDLDGSKICVEVVIIRPMVSEDLRRLGL